MSRWTAWVGMVLLDVVPVLAVGVVTFYLLCLHVADCYPVPSDSMEPTIHGDRRRGDLVLVDKTAWWWSRTPAPFDLVVIRGTDPGDNLMVKRCVALGPATLRIADGDLYRAAADGSFSAPIAKDPAAFADMRVPVFRYPDPRCEQTLEEFFHLPPGFARVRPDRTVELAPAASSPDGIVALLRPEARRAEVGATAPRIPGFLTTNKGIDTSYLTPAGRREWQGMNFYADIGIEVDLEVAEGTGVVFVLEFRQRDYALVWGPGNAGIQWTVGGVATSRSREGEPAPVLKPGRHRLVFGYLDGRLFLLDGGRAVVLEPLALARHHDYAPGRPNGLQLGCVGEADLRIHRLQVFHDVPVTTLGGRDGGVQGDSFVVGAGHMFLLGDNAHDSADSRGPLGSVVVDRLVGRPWAILAPWSRIRVFRR